MWHKSCVFLLGLVLDPVTCLKFIRGKFLLVESGTIKDKIWVLGKCLSWL